MIEIRCKSCNKLLGKFRGAGEIKCPRTSCNAVNKFDTGKKIHKLVNSRSHELMEKRQTSSGVTFR